MSDALNGIAIGVEDCQAGLEADLEAWQNVVSWKPLGEFDGYFGIACRHLDDYARPQR